MGGVSRDLAYVHTRERRVGDGEKMCEVRASAVVLMCTRCVFGRSTVSRSVSTLQDIPEVVDEGLERAAAESPG